MIFSPNFIYWSNFVIEKIIPFFGIYFVHYKYKLINVLRIKLHRFRVAIQKPQYAVMHLYTQYYYMLYYSHALATSNETF